MSALPVRILALAAAFLSTALVTAQAAARSLVFAPAPIEQPETVISNSRPLVHFLSQQLGVPVHIRYEKNNAEILRLFQEGKIDIVHLGPLPYVTLRQSYQKAEPLVAFNESDGSPTYICALVAAFDGPATPRQVRRSVALTQPLSTCGHLSAGYLLNKYNIQLDSLPHAYLGNHDMVAVAVVKGDYEVGTLKTTVAHKYVNLTLRVIEETPKFPGFLLVGNRTTLSPAQLNKITAALLKLSKNDRQGLILGKYGFSATSDADYALIRQYSRFFY